MTPTTMVYDDQQCPARGPGLNHTLNGTPVCVACGAPCDHRNRTDAGVIATTAVTTVPAVTTSPLRLDDAACHCSTCRHPSDGNADTRALHQRRHEEFVSWIADNRRGEVALHHPSPREIRAMKWLESHAEPLGGRCRLPEHRNMPVHPATH